ALDRLVSTQDYADFARSFAGIGKASAACLSDGKRQFVHVTIAGTDDIPIEPSSDLYRNLVKALRDFGDPYLPIQVQSRELLLLIIQASVRVLPDYQWESVKPNVVAALQRKFSFQQRELGQDALASEVISTIQAVEGVAFVDLDNFGALNEEEVRRSIAEQSAVANLITLEDRITAKLAWVEAKTRIRPAQLAHLSSAVETTLILNEVTG
ncbi:MAG: hypothetical protein ABL888_04220, partial [Pirellulaceae bacterium]